MRTLFGSPSFAFAVLSALLGLGCQVGGGDPMPMRFDGGTDGALPPGVDGGVPTDGTVPTDRGLPATDSDMDGLSDADERTRGTNPFAADSDGDGFDDGVEVIAGTDPTSRFSGIPAGDFYVVLPFEGPVVHRELEFRARLGRADIYFLVDTTGSMGGPIENVRTSLRTTIVPTIADTIADAFMGVGDFRDFPLGGYGSPGDWAITVRQPMTADVTAVQTALDMLLPGGGGDGPESATEGLFVSVEDPCPVPDGGWGAACFRDGTHPIIVLVTDIAFHNGSNPMNDYDPAIVPGARLWAETIESLIDHDVRVLGVPVGSWSGSGAVEDVRALTEFTSSYDASGNLTVYESPDGNVDRAVVNGIVDLVGAVNQDVTSSTRDFDGDDTDATDFILSIRPIRSSRPTSFDETTFYDVPGGTMVTFDVTFENAIRPARSTVQIYRAYIDIEDTASGTRLDTRNVYVVIPPDGGIIF